MCFGYVITNKLNGMEYIGITSRTIKKRYQEHLNTNNSQYIHRAMRKYGKNNFSVKQIVEMKSWKEICEWEIEMILTRDTLAPNGYNETMGGEGTCGVIYTKEQRIKISKRMKEAFAIDHNKIKVIIKKTAKTLKENPDIQINRNKNHKKTLKENPNIVKNSIIKRQKTLKNNPDILKNAVSKRQKTLKNNPDILKNSGIKVSNYIKDNPQSMIDRKIKTAKTLKENPDITKIGSAKRSKIMREKGRNGMLVLIQGMCFRSIMEASRFLKISKQRIYTLVEKQKGFCKKLVKDQKYPWKIKY